MCQLNNSQCFVKVYYIILGTIILGFIGANIGILTITLNTSNDIHALEQNMVSYSEKLTKFVIEQKENVKNLNVNITSVEENINLQLLKNDNKTRELLNTITDIIINDFENILTEIKTIIVVDSFNNQIELSDQINNIIKTVKNEYNLLKKLQLKKILLFYFTI